ncbi:MAG TPA: DUF3110 domain-containing protein [Nostocaceae cyanobacterium]|nr:DUF3110 domain-containing protein [Nostocaceae cyanobacterium]
MITPMRVFVLIFNAGTDNEGIHTVHINNRDRILMFESEDDATRYALMLEAQDFPSPTVEGMDAEDIKEFCQQGGYDWEIVPINGLVLPPEINLEKTDWQADDFNNSNDAKEDILDSSPVAQEMSESELDNIRRKLEGLL